MPYTNPEDFCPICKGGVVARNGKMPYKYGGRHCGNGHFWRNEEPEKEEPKAPDGMDWVFTEFVYRVSHERMFAMTRPQVAFISGHLKLTEEEFFTYYVPHIEDAMKSNCDFVIGDARGVDSFAHAMLMRVFAEEPHRVTVYHMMEHPRYTTLFPVVGGFLTDNARDEAMTIASDFDIAWVRPGRETSGTAANLERRKLFGEFLKTTLYQREVCEWGLGSAKELHLQLAMYIAKQERNTPPKAK